MIKVFWVIFIKFIDIFDYVIWYNYDKNVFFVCLVCGYLNF